MILNYKLFCFFLKVKSLNTGLYIFYFFYFLIIIIYLFIIFGCVGSSLLRVGFSLVAGSGDYSSLQYAGFSLWWLLLSWSTVSKRAGFSSCGVQAQ